MASKNGAGAGNDGAIVVGGGPAGLTAAITLAEGGIATTLVAKPQPSARITAPRLCSPAR